MSGTASGIDAGLIQQLTGTARRLGLESLSVRREDRNGIGFGGTKSRTMARVLAAAAAQGKSVLVMPARAGSNAVLAASMLAQRHGIRLHAVLRPQPHSPQALRNLALICASGCTISPVTLDVSLRLDRPFLTALADQLLRAGEQAEIMPFGAETIEAGLAHHDTMKALAQHWSDTRATPPDSIYMASASFDSGAGVLAGLAASGLPCKLVLVSVAQDEPPSPPAVMARARTILARTGSRAGRVAEPEIRDALAPGFGRTGQAQLAAAAALDLPFVLDPSYTAKAAAALADDARDRLVERPLLWFGCPDARLLDQHDPSPSALGSLRDQLLFS